VNTSRGFGLKGVTENPPPTGQQQKPRESVTRLQSLMVQEDAFGSKSDAEKSKFLAELIDLSLDIGNRQGIELGVRLAESTIEAIQDSAIVALLHYFAANGYDWLSRDKRSEEQSNQFDWIHDEREREILHLRKAIICPDFDKLHIQHRCSIYVNLANALSTIGRSVEGLILLRKSIELLPAYGMAVGNLGSHLLLLSDYMPTDKYRVLYLHAACQHIEQALAEKKGLTQEAISDFERKHQRLVRLLGEERVDLQELAQRVSNSSQSDQEVDYRRWVSKETLFLCPINDLIPLGTNGHDCLHLPTITRPIGEGPHLHGIVNQLIQEFVSIRFQVYEGINARDVHFSDKKVHLISMTDFASYSLSLERLRVAFRVLFSLFDKIAFFMNLYFDLKVPYEKVSFGKIWYDANSEIHEGFQARQNNRPLQGLFWLSKDLAGNDDRYLEPEADKLRAIRNYLEHKYLKVIEWEEFNQEPDFDDPLKDSVALKVSRRHFVDKTVHLLRLARSALIYLLLAVEFEEKSKQNGENTISIPVSRYDDEWKR